MSPTHPPLGTEPEAAGQSIKMRVGTNVAGHQITNNGHIHVETHLHENGQLPDQPRPDRPPPPIEPKPSPQWPHTPRPMVLVLALVLLGVVLVLGYIPRQASNAELRSEPALPASSVSTSIPAPASPVPPAASSPKSAPTSTPIPPAFSSAPVPTLTPPSGVVVFSDDFTGNFTGNWTTFVGQVSSQPMIDGALGLSSNPTLTQAFSDTLTGIIGKGMDTIMEFDVSTAGRGEFGASCRFREGAAYKFGAKTDGSVSISKIVGGKAELLPGGDWRSAGVAMRPGVNHVLTACRNVSGGVRLELRINGTLVVEVVDQNPIASGTLGFYAAGDSSQGQGVSITLDNLIVRKP